MVVFCALQFAGVPPFTPEHVHVHGPTHVMVDAIHVVQRLSVGAAIRVVPLTLPHTPGVGRVHAESVQPVEVSGFASVQYESDTIILSSRWQVTFRDFIPVPQVTEHVP